MRIIIVVNALIWSLLLVVSACGQDVDNASPSYRGELPEGTRTLGPRIGQDQALVQITEWLPEGHNYQLRYEDKVTVPGWWENAGLDFFQFGVYQDDILVGRAAAFEMQGLTMFSVLTPDGASTWQEAEEFDFGLLIPEAVTASSGSNPTVAQYSQQRAQDKAAAFYPPEVELRYWQRLTIEGLECYAFEVYHAEQLVSRAAVTLAGDQVFFQEMQQPESSLYYPSTDFGLAADYHYEAPADEDLSPESYLALSPSEDGRSLYIANLQLLPEFAPANEGSASWRASTQTLQVILTRAQPAYQGTVTGPQLRMEVDYSTGGPNITALELRPAPVYSNPRAVLLSGETLYIETARLLEIADILRDLVLNFDQ